MSQSKPLPPVELLREVFDYNPQNGKLTWRKSPAPNIKVGSHAGCCGCGYYQVKLQGRKHMVHRLIWCIVSGEDPGKLEIDHINGNKIDNRLCNLRLANRSENVCNIGLRVDNNSGCKGVSWHKSHKAWRASIQKERKWCHLGYFATIEEAHAAYMFASANLHGDFARVA